MGNYIWRLNNITRVIVAKRDLPAGTKLTAAELGFVECRIASVPDVVSTDTTEFIGYTLLRNHMKGDPIFRDQVYDERTVIGGGDPCKVLPIKIDTPNLHDQPQSGDLVSIHSSDGLLLKSVRVWNFDSATSKLEILLTEIQTQLILNSKKDLFTVTPTVD